MLRCKSRPAMLTYDKMPLETGRFAILRSSLVSIATGFILALALVTILPAAAQERSVIEHGEDLLANLAEPIFEAAEIEADGRFRIELRDSAAPKAALLTKDKARVTTGLIRLVERPEELGAAIAWLVAVREVEGPAGSFARRYRFLSEPPGDEAYSSRSMSTDERTARSSERAAEEVLDRQQGLGPDMEQLRARAERLDSKAVQLLRRAGLPARVLQTLYKRLQEARAGLLDRHDYAAREVLRDQVRWLENRTAPNELRPPFWQEHDAKLTAVQDALAE